MSTTHDDQVARYAEPHTEPLSEPFSEDAIAAVKAKVAETTSVERAAIDPNTLPRAEEAVNALDSEIARLLEQVSKCRSDLAISEQVFQSLRESLAGQSS